MLLAAPLGRGKLRENGAYAPPPHHHSHHSLTHILHHLESINRCTPRRSRPRRPCRTWRVASVADLSARQGSYVAIAIEVLGSEVVGAAEAMSRRPRRKAKIAMDVVRVGPLDTGEMRVGLECLPCVPRWRAPLLP